MLSGWQIWVWGSVWFGGWREVVEPERLCAVYERLWLPEVCMAVTERYMQLPSSLRGPFALISTRSGTRLVKYSFAHFLTRLEKTSPSVQCVAKCRRSQMPPRETCQPHIAVGWQVIEKILETERILKQTLWIYQEECLGNLYCCELRLASLIWCAALDIPHEI